MAQSGGRPQSQPVAAANVLDGFLSFSTSAVATTIVTVPAGRTWVGTVSLNVDCMINAAVVTAGQSTGTVSIAGVGATPPAGTVFQVSCRTGANVAGGTSAAQAASSAAIPLQVTAPAGNSVAIQVAATQGGTLAEMDCTAVGALQ